MNVSPNGHLAGMPHVLPHAAHQCQDDGSLGQLLPKDGGVQGMHQVLEVLARVLLQGKGARCVTNPAHVLQNAGQAVDAGKWKANQAMWLQVASHGKACRCRADCSGDHIWAANLTQGQSTGTERQKHLEKLHDKL